jgi:hypothetical protein
MDVEAKPEWEWFLPLHLIAGHALAGSTVGEFGKELEAGPIEAVASSCPFGY